METKTHFHSALWVWTGTVALLFGLMMTFKNTQQFQTTSIIHPGTCVQQCMEFVLSLLRSWIWRKAANELFFLIIGVPGPDYQSKKPVCMWWNVFVWVGGVCVCVHVCVSELMKAITLALVLSYHVGALPWLPWLERCLEPLTVSDKTSSTSLACTCVSRWDTAWQHKIGDSIRISESSVSSRSPRGFAPNF